MSEKEEDDSGESINFKNDSDEKRRPPLFRNDDHGITAWVDEDRNGNYFLRLRLPLGIGTVPIFVNDSEYVNLRENFNKLVDHQIEEKDQEK